MVLREKGERVISWSFEGVVVVVDAVQVRLALYTIDCRWRL